MNATKHTPAPWFPGVTLGTGRHCIIGDGDSVICTASRDGMAISQADTALICAAPDMRALLAAIVRNVGNYNPAFPMASGMAATHALHMQQARELLA